LNKNEWDCIPIKDQWSWEDSQHIKNLTWGIRFTANEYIGLSANTQTEDNIQAIKDNWEKIEPGRAEKALNSRKRYIA